MQVHVQYDNLNSGFYMASTPDSAQKVTGLSKESPELATVDLLRQILQIAALGHDISDLNFNQIQYV